MKRKIKKKRKSSFINDSSSEEEVYDDPEYLPKTRASKKKALMLKKITP